MGRTPARRKKPRPVRHLSSNAYWQPNPGVTTAMENCPWAATKMPTDGHGFCPLVAMKLPSCLVDC